VENVRLSPYLSSSLLFPDLPTLVYYFLFSLPKPTPPPCLVPWLEERRHLLPLNLRRRDSLPPPPPARQGSAVDQSQLWGGAVRTKTFGRKDWYADIQLRDLAGAKRAASIDVGTDRAAKRSKTVPDAATIRAVQERMSSLEADQALNSDDDFVGAFDDDEELGSDEHEDEIDQDIVVSALQSLFLYSLMLSYP